LADIPTPDEFFPEMAGFAHAGIFRSAKRPWDPLPMISEYIENYLSGRIAAERLPKGLELMGSGDDRQLFCTEPVTLQEDILCSEISVFIGAGAKIEPTAVIRSRTIIGEKCEVRHGAYLRGNIIAGRSCTLGHATEIKDSIIMNHSEMGHFNYIGNSIIGSFVNIGAGTKLANLKFRSAAAKRELSFPELSFIMNKTEVKTSLYKLGAIIGDYCETGCNSVLSPCVLLGPECWVYPNLTVASGCYAPKTFLLPENMRVKPHTGP